jgi:hypothetical protein
MVELAFLPCLALALALAFAWRGVRNATVRRILQVAAALLFFLPQPLVVFLGAYSPRLWLYQQGIFSLWASAVCALLLIALLAPGSTFAGIQARRAPMSKPTVAAAAIVTGALGLYFGWNVVGDSLFERDIAAGRVEGIRVVHHSRSPDAYEVVIAKRAHNIPLSLVSTLHMGDDVRAEVGFASGTVLAVQKTR